MTLKSSGNQTSLTATLLADLLGVDLESHETAPSHVPAWQDQASPASADASGQAGATSAPADWSAHGGHYAAQFRKRTPQAAAATGGATSQASRTPRQPAATHPAATGVAHVSTPRSLAATVGNLAQQAGLSQRGLLAGAAFLGLGVLMRDGLTGLSQLGQFVGSSLCASVADTLFGAPWGNFYGPASFSSMFTPSFDARFSAPFSPSFTSWGAPWCGTSSATPYVSPLVGRMSEQSGVSVDRLITPLSGEACPPGWNVGFGNGASKHGRSAGWGGTGW